MNSYFPEEKFGKAKATHGDLLDPLVHIQTQEEFDAYRKRYIEHYIIVFALPEDKAIDIADNNIAYFARYFSTEERERIDNFRKKSW